jgi:2-polyprenyl-3-methyl-5-hydroxy-6-metoxy-1,4-benzoquinol methylase
MLPSYACWCGADDVVALGAVAAAQLLRCERCGTFRVDPPPVRSQQDAEALYSAYYGHATAAGDDAGMGPSVRRSRFWQVAAAVPELDRAGRRAADIGCGDGTLCGELHAAGWAEVTGFDVSHSRIRRCRERFPGLPFHDTSVGAAGIAPEAFDLMVMDNVIEHVAQPAQLLGELAPFLATGGRLVLITPNMQSGHFRMLGRRWTPELAPHVHVYLFTASSLAALVEQAGLRVCATGTFHVPSARWPEWRRRIVQGDLKGLAWRVHQDLGGAYGRLIGAGPMLYAVAEPAL